MSLFLEPNIYKKINLVEQECNKSLNPTYSHKIPDQPAREVEVSDPKLLEKRPGLQTAEGQARLLHDLANIELQAMELGLRTLQEFNKQTSSDFKEQLISIILDEAKHLNLCLEGIEKLGFQWGDWPVHLLLWNCVDKKDTIIDRIHIVHQYLEGSGLDSSEIILQKLSGVKNKQPRNIVKIIAEEEISHVEFGNYWYKYFCVKNGLDPESDFKSRLLRLTARLPVRRAKLNTETRKKAGFSLNEINILDEFMNQKRAQHG